MNQSDVKPEHLPAAPVLKPILFSILTLISGIAIGAGLTLIVTGKPDARPSGPEYMSRRMIEHIAKELQLSPEQREQLDPIVNQHMKAINEIRKEARPKISDEIKQMNEEIIAILDEGQKQIWEDKIKRMQEHFERMRERRGGPGGGRRDGTGPGPGPRRDKRGPDGQFRENRPPEGPLPPGEKPPIDEVAPPKPTAPPEAPPAEEYDVNAV